jgi:type II secretory ATPase GspE/PulE/Tfp pilus assembly ATPase PilB-like protein
MRTLRQEALNKARRGETSLDEVIRETPRTVVEHHHQK